MKNKLFACLLFLVTSTSVVGSAGLPRVFDFYGHILGETQLKHRYTLFYSELSTEIRTLMESSENTSNIEKMAAELTDQLPSLCDQNALKFFPSSGNILHIFTWWTRKALSTECRETTHRWLEKIRLYAKAFPSED